MTIGIIACSLVGVGFLIYALYETNRLGATKDWLQATGAITKAVIEISRDSESTTYSAAVSYDYVVNGASYSGERIGLDKRAFVRKKNAQKELDKYPVNSTVIVYFDPEKPADAALERNYPYLALHYTIGIGMLVLVIWMLWQHAAHSA